MRAAIYRRTGGPEVIEVVDLDVPEPGLSEIRIKVLASSMSYADAGAWGGVFPGPADGAYYGIGWDIAGVVDAVGPGGMGDLFPVGTHVIAITDGAVRVGRAHAEFAVVPASAVALAPSGVDPVLAATIPLNGLTAAQSVELAAVRPGDTVVVVGAAGGVGSIAAKLASLRGARVIGYDVPDQEDYVLEHTGAESFVAAGEDPGALLRALVPGGADSLINTAPLGTELIGAVKDRGIFVTTRFDLLPQPERDVRIRATVVGAEASVLQTLSDLAGAGELPLRVAGTFPLEEASTAYAQFVSGPTQGKYVLTVP